jgi:phage/conjugal plasmid C-4 type zinc finger TraR family protein
MVDQYDRAQALDAYYRNQALEIRRRSAPAATASALNCKDCGEEIPELRRKHAPGCTRCRDCQQQWEKNNL